MATGPQPAVGGRTMSWRVSPWCPYAASAPAPSRASPLSPTAESLRPGCVVASAACRQLPPAGSPGGSRALGHRLRLMLLLPVWLFRHVSDTGRQGCPLSLTQETEESHRSGDTINVGRCSSLTALCSLDLSICIDLSPNDLTPRMLEGLPRLGPPAPSCVASNDGPKEAGWGGGV